MFRKPDLIVRIERTRGEEYVSFRTSTQPPDEIFDLGSVVYAATGEKIPLSSYDDLSKELQKHLDTIEAYFPDEYVKNPDSLRAAQKEYRETLSLVEGSPQKGPKIIPLLHYPLMGIILLLLFGALTTLYMVLLDRLFSSISLNPDSYVIFMGVGAILLAIGSMLLFRKLTKKG